MTEHQRLFLVQADSNFRAYKLFRGQETLSLHSCHILYYLQMAMELLGKAHAWKQGPTRKTHRAFVNFLRSLSFNRKAQKKLGYAGKIEMWEHKLRKSVSLAQAIENLAPANAGEGPNHEYPWPPDTPTGAPVEFEFPVWTELTEKAHGHDFLALVEHLFSAAETYL